MRSANDIHPGALIGGKYRVRAILGRKHGLTVDAFHTAFDQRAIIKLLLPNQADAREVERFRREARALSKIASEHVARILDVGTEADGTFYLVRQYLEGTDLEKHIHKTGALPLSDAILFTLQACEAVAEAHANAIVVRDLEPAHLFLTQRTGGAPLIKITDFGTAKLIGGAQDAAGEITGTAMFGLTPYASPELVRKARDVDVRTDVWSLGTILYEMLAGRPPFLGEAAALMLAITRDQPAPIARIRGDVSQELDTVLGWALSKDVEGRFRSVHAFAHALLPFSPPEGHLLVDRIGQITQAARERKASGSVPPPSSVPMPSAPPPRGSAPGSQPPAAWLPAPTAPPISGLAPGRLPAEMASMPVSDDDETSIIPGSLNRAALQQMVAPKSVPMPPASSPMKAAQAPIEAPPTDAFPAAAPAAASASASASAPASASASASAPVAAPAPAPAPVAAPAPVKDNNNLVRALLAFCVVGLLLAVVLIVMLLQKRPGDMTAGASGQAAPSATTTAIEVAPPATTPAPPPVASTAPPAASASAAPAVAALPPEKTSEEPAPKGGNAGSSDTSSKTPPPPPAGGGGGGNGTLVAVAVGGPCNFSVNGASKGRSASLRLSLRAGTYTVACKPTSGAAKSKSVTVRPGETAMAMFKN